MNYFAHGMRFIDRPYLLAGTAVPDWLSVADRKVRMRRQRVEPFTADDDPIRADVACGILQHLEDDRWFHQTPAFFEVTGELARRFREALGNEDGHRAGFLGHIVTELLLDAVLMEQHPEVIEAYYDALQSVDPLLVQAAVNEMARGETERLAWFIDIFGREQFLRDYADTARLRYRLNQVMGRVRLKPLPSDVEPVFVAGFELVAERLSGLLPPELYTATSFAESNRNG